MAEDAPAWLAGQLARKKRNMAQRAYNHAEYLAQRRKRILVLFGLATPKAKSKKQKAKSKKQKAKSKKQKAKSKKQKAKSREVKD
ncbi:hypothetical protein [Bordetella bronchiseptica]